MKFVFIREIFLHGLKVTFYVLKTEILNTYVKHQKSISLNSLLKLNPAVIDYLIKIIRLNPDNSCLNSYNG
ncbi:hypothetical protein [Pedobacter glucosidilyticus]|uniref:hypothetical protein n=1 Tax=Pedobacter glucosidilyticus TaxID=1122941 RepID=UPI0026F169DF|nr:hypothetical protein [Pedobacter glucosidilyticus]